VRHDRGTAAFRALAQSPSLGNLAELNLLGNGLTEVGARVLPGILKQSRPAVFCPCLSCPQCRNNRQSPLKSP
jgi:hypothetical protein